MAQQLRAWTALSGNSKKFPAPIAGGSVTPTFNSSSRGSDALFWTPQAPTLKHVHSHITKINKLIKLKKKNFKKSNLKNPSGRGVNMESQDIEG